MITLNWGILGAGNISGQFVHDLLLNNTNNQDIKHVVRSIGCSSSNKGQQFIKDHKIDSTNNEGIEPVVEQYEDLYSNKELDIVYIGTPHVFHKEQVVQCLNHDLHVLCEKPMTVNKQESIELVELAKSKQKFLMEAVWTRFLPIVNQLKSQVFDDKIIGEVFRFYGDFSYDGDIPNCPKESRVRNKHLAAGALLDIGIYPITYGRILLDQNLGNNHTPFECKSIVTVDPEDEVDYNTSILIKYKNGKHAILTTSNFGDTHGPFATIEGTNGYIEMFANNPARLRLYKIHKKSGEVIEIKDDEPYLGFIHEANAIARDISNNQLQNSTMPHDETLLVMDIMDKVRYENGFKYPME